MSTPSGSPPLYVVGAGALGLRFALECRDHSPVLVTREAERRNAILRTVDHAGLPTQEARGELTPLSSIERFPDGALLFICTKLNGLGEILPQISPRVPESATVVLCQNGLGVFDQAADSLPQAMLIRLMARFGSLKVDATAIRASGSFAVTLAAADGERAAKGMNAVKELLRDCGCEVLEAPNPRTAEWQKTVINVLTNSVATLLDMQNAILIEDPSAWKVAESMLAECRAVAKADGVDISDGFDADDVRSQITRYRENTNSTLVDLRAGRPSELPWLLGAVVASAARNKVPVPVCSAISELLSTIERQRLLLRI